MDDAAGAEEAEGVVDTAVAGATAREVGDGVEVGERDPGRGICAGVDEARAGIGRALARELHPGG